MSVKTHAEAKPLLMIGQNGRGHWVVCDRCGSCGALFLSRRHAIRYAMFDRSPVPQAAIMVPGVLELDEAYSTTAVVALPREASESKVFRHAA